MRGGEKAIWIGDGQPQFKPTVDRSAETRVGDYEIEVEDVSSWFVI
jgi:hypothetical protein